MQQPAYHMRMRTAMVGLGQQWIAAPAWMAASEEVAKGSRVMSARSSSTFLHTQHSSPARNKPVCYACIHSPTCSSRSHAAVLQMPPKYAAEQHHCLPSQKISLKTAQAGPKPLLCAPVQLCAALRSRVFTTQAKPRSLHMQPICPHCGSTLAFCAIKPEVWSSMLTL